MTDSANYHDFKCHKKTRIKILINRGVSIAISFEFLFDLKRARELSDNRLFFTLGGSGRQLWC